MTLILAIGDLHIPERAVEIPPKFKRLLSAPGKISQVLCHGNVTRSPGTLNFLRSISSDFQLVKGQLDLGQSALPTSLVFTHDQLKVGLISGSCVIPNSDPLSLLTQARMMDVDILLFGGTHKLEAYTLDGKFFISPGSASGAFTTNLPDREDFDAIESILKREYKKDTVDPELKEEEKQEIEEDTSLSENQLNDPPELSQDIEELLHPIPSFCLLDVKGISCTLYLYTYVGGDVKVDKVSYRKHDA